MKKNLILFLTVGLFLVNVDCNGQEYKKKELIGTYVAEAHMIKVAYIKLTLKLKRNNRFNLQEIFDNTERKSSGNWTIDRDTLILILDNSSAESKIEKYTISRDSTNRIMIGIMNKK